MSVDYASIYDHVVRTDPRYDSAQHSPGYRACLMWADRLRGIRGPALDVGCGVGFVVDLLLREPFHLDAHGVDVSAEAVRRARLRCGEDRIHPLTEARLPFEDGRFALVTCFDVLEHLEEDDASALVREIRRVAAPGGLVFCSASCRPAGIVDQHGDNVHRTVRPAWWWVELVEPDEALVRRPQADVLMWWTRPAV